MKKVNKSDIPESFRLYTSNSNNASNNWDDLRGEKAIYSDIRTTIFEDQGRICAYCEQDFSCNAGDDDYITQMVEHFHPKRDINTKNWALDWNNLLGCCTGGTEANGSIFPRPDNLSCDKY